MEKGAWLGLWYLIIIIACIGTGVYFTGSWWGGPCIGIVIFVFIIMAGSALRMLAAKLLKSKG